MTQRLSAARRRGSPPARRETGQVNVEATRRPWVNFHRPCYFAIEEVDDQGKIRKRYPQQFIMTPFDKLETLSPATMNLRPGITLANLECQALHMTDNQAARAQTNARSKLFRSIHRRSKTAA